MKQRLRRHGRGVRRKMEHVETQSQKVDSDDGAFEAEWRMESFKFLMCLNVMKRDKVYQGTVTFKNKAKRRSLNTRQKASRRANR